jgi:ADP-heptose:LPS heptosyltransferase
MAYVNNTPYVPGTEQLLCTAVVVDASSATTAAQPLFVVPQGMKAVVRQVLLRNASANLATAVYTVGSTTAPTSIAAATTIPAAGLPAETTAVHPLFPTPAASFNNGSSAYQAVLQAGESCAIQFTSHVAGECYVDVIGYLVAI